MKFSWKSEVRMKYNFGFNTFQFYIVIGDIERT